MNKLWIGVVLVLALGPLSLAQPYKDSPAQNLFEEATNLLENEYFGVKQINWAQLFAKYQGLVDAACAVQKNQCAYATVEPLMAQMFAELGDGHAFYLSAANVQSINQLNQGNLASSNLRLGYIATRFCDTPGGACSTSPSGQIVERQLPEQFVQHVTPNSPAALSGLRYGDRILGYNGVQYTDAPSNAELSQMAADFAKKVQAGEAITLRIQRGAERQNLELKMTGAIIQEAELPQLEVRDDKIAILTIKTFYIRGIAQRVHNLLRSAMEQNVRGVVINLRGTSGGFATESLAIIAAFIEQPSSLRYVPRYDAAQTIVDLTYRDAQATIVVNGQVVESLKIDNPVLFKGPVAVLVDGQCASACEYVPLFVQRAQRGLVYGLPTNGVANTTTQQVPLKSGSVASIPTLQTHWLEGMTLLPERAQPDATVPNFYFEHFRTGRDLPLEQALTRLG